MHRSVFFRRVLALLFIALLLWTVLTALIYGLISRPLFIRLKVAEISPRAEFVARMASQSILGSDPFFDSLLVSANDFFGAWVFVIDGLSGQTRSTTLPEEVAAAEPFIQETIDSHIPALMSGDYTSLWFTGRIPPVAGLKEILFVGVPVSVRFGFQTQVVGAVFFVKPLDELNAGLNSLNITLLISSLLVLLLMVGPVYLAIARLIRPLRQTRDVALAMAEGDFSVRADSGQRGEIGELATAMNNLSGALSANLADLTLERNRLRQIITGMNDGLVAVDERNRITAVNPAFRSLFQLDSQLSPQDETTWPDLPELESAFAQAVSSSAPGSVNLTRNGRLISGRIVPLSDESGQAAGAVGLFSDVTEAERLEQTRRDYIANVSHELRTPLTAMRALIEPLKDGLVASDQDRDRYYGIMLRESIRLSRLIDDMLELSRLQAGATPIPISDFDLPQLLDDLAMKIEGQIREAGLTFKLPDRLTGCPQVRGDPDRIEQVLVILLDNAVKYTPAGGEIRIQLSWNRQQVKVFVQDNGVGIDPQDLPHIFERFYKADKAHQQPGTGLGLAIAREIMKRFGQSIEVRSEPGKGSIFSFTLERSCPSSAADSI